MKQKDHPGQPILLFDGVCNLCNHFVQFILRYDSHSRIRLGSLQSEAGRQLLEQFGLDAGEGIPDTVVLLYEGKSYTQSEAVLRTFRLLGRPWSWLSGPLGIIPTLLRNRIYAWVSRNRYRWFGKQESCMLPTPEIRERFLPGG